VKCEVCNETELEGELGVQEPDLGGTNFRIAIVEVGRRNWICCDSCNRIVCHNCCEHPRNGYCDSCIETYNLTDHLKEVV
jgi:hypothetical protein